MLGREEVSGPSHTVLGKLVLTAPKGGTLVDMSQVPEAVSSSLAAMPPSCEPYECLQTVTPLCRLPICPNPNQAQRPFHPGMPAPCTG